MPDNTPGPDPRPKEQSDATRRMSPGDITKESARKTHGKPSRRKMSPPPDPKSNARSTRPLAPENTALADDLRSHLKGKPTHSGHYRTWYSELFSVFAAVAKVVLVLALCFSFLIGGFGAGMLVGYVSTTTPVTGTDIRLSGEKQTSFVYDANGRVIARLTGRENVDRIYVSFRDVQHTYINEAIMAIEDERFLEHSGIDVRRIGSALLSAFFGVGESHGGSTITQQTIKMMSGQDQVSTQRKVQEWYRAMWFEQEVSKDEIMDYYINLAPMGNNYIGVQAAAQNYFGKDASDLSLVECAFLAGIPRSPSYYNPLRETGRRNAMRRMRIVLAKMHELEMITDQEYEDALNTELEFRTSSQTTATQINSFFVEYAVSEVINDLMDQRNISRSLATTLVYNRGYHIYTTMEPEVQAVLDEAFLTESLFQTNPEALEDLPEKPQGSMVIINVETGAIAGMQGGYGPKTANMVTNRAVSAFRQPGSAIKPILSYAPALEMGYVTASTLYDDKESFLDPDNPNTPWPRNADGRFAGPMTIRRAITSSRNTIAVQVWTDIGGERALWFLQQTGIDRTEEVYPSTAVGGFSLGMTSLEMAAAYATFPNKGVFCEPYAYTKVLDSEDNVVLEKLPARRAVYSEATAFILNDIMKGVITGGTATGQVHTIQNSDGESIAVAGKTGTTDNYRDRWFCGYTPYYAAAVWYGYDNRLRTTEIPRGNDRNSAMRIFDYVMQRIHEDLPGADFERPENVVSRTVCTHSGLLANEYCREEDTAVTDYFVIGDPLTPSDTCFYHVEPEEDEEDDDNGDDEDNNDD